MTCPKCKKEFEPTIKREAFKRGKDHFELDWAKCPHCNKWVVVARIINGKKI